MLALWKAAEREQIKDPLLYVDDLSIVRLTSGLADVFGDHMVLQRGKPLPVWGWAKDAGQKVAVALNGQAMTIINARARLQEYLSWLPDAWD